MAGAERAVAANRIASGENLAVNVTGIPSGIGWTDDSTFERHPQAWDRQADETFNLLVDS